MEAIVHSSYALKRNPLHTVAWASAKGNCSVQLWEMWQETGKLFQNCFSNIAVSSLAGASASHHGVTSSGTCFQEELKVTIQWALKSSFIPFCWGNRSSTSLLWGCGWGRKVATRPFSHWSPSSSTGQDEETELTYGNLCICALKRQGVSFQAPPDTVAEAKGAPSNLSVSIKG